MPLTSFALATALRPLVYHARRRLHTLPLIAGPHAGKLSIRIFVVFGLTRPGIEPESTASVADAISTRPLIVLVYVQLAVVNEVSRYFIQGCQNLKEQKIMQHLEVILYA